MFKVQCNEKDIIHIHAFGNGAEHHGTASGSQKAGSAKGTTVESGQNALACQTLVPYSHPDG